MVASLNLRHLLPLVFQCRDLVSKRWVSGFETPQGQERWTWS